MQHSTSTMTLIRCSDDNTRTRRKSAPLRFTAIVLLLSLLHPSLASTCVHPSATVAPLTPPSLPRNDHLVVETQLQRVADSFESVLEATSASLENNIPMEPLLDACRTLLAVMEKTGPKAVARDFGNNLKKIESVHQPLTTHTVSSLLQLERDSGVHREGNESSLYLRDKSGAMGLLWIRRTLAFQSDFYEQLLEGKDPLDAVNHAYQEHLKPYHGRIIQKCYNLLVGNNLPPRSLLLARVGGYQDETGDDLLQFRQHEEKTLQDLKRLVASWRPLIQHWKRSFVELGMEDTRRV